MAILDLKTVVITGANAKHLGQAEIANGSNTTLYTCPAETTAIVNDIQIVNTTGAAVDITVWIDPDGTTADDTTAIFKDWSVPANDFLHWAGGFKVLEATGTIKATAGTANAITITVDGAEVT